MKGNFAPYLGDVLPAIWAMATLNPEMGVQGMDKLASLTDVLAEVTPDSGEAGKKTSIVTDEIEEKDVAI